MNIDIKDNIKEVQREFRAFGQKLVTKSATKALNDVGAKATTQSRREIARQAGVKVRDVRDYIKSKRARWNYMVYVINHRQHGYKLGMFKPKQGADGVTVNVAGTSKFIEGAFVATMKSSHRGVFVRAPGNRRGKARPVQTGKNVGKMYKPALPIKELYGTTVIGSYKQVDIERITKDLVQKDFRNAFIRNLRFYSQR